MGVCGAMLAALLLPVLGNAVDKAAPKGTKEVCADNLKKLGAAFAMYAADYGDSLPAFRDKNNMCALQLVSPYLDQGVKGSATLPYFGADYLRCPSRGPKDGGDDFTTYGLNYPYMFGYAPDFPNIPGQYGGPKLKRIPAYVFMAADSHGGAPVIYYPGDAWALTLDTDKDGVKDSFSIDYLNNGLKPIHDAGANFLFADQHVEWKSLKSWAANDKNMWGTPYYGDYR